MDSPAPGLSGETLNQKEKKMGADYVSRFVKALGKKPTGEEIMEYVNNYVDIMVRAKIMGHEALEHHGEPTGRVERLESLFHILFDYLGVETKDEPARRIIVKKKR